MDVSPRLSRHPRIISNWLGDLRGKIRLLMGEVRSFLPQSGKLLYAQIPKGGFFSLLGWLAWKEVGEIYYIFLWSEVLGFLWGGNWKKRFVGYWEMAILFFGLEEMGWNFRFSNARGVHFLCLERYHDTIDDTQTPSAIIWNKRVWVCTCMDGIFLQMDYPRLRGKRVRLKMPPSWCLVLHPSHVLHCRFESPS